MTNGAVNVTTTQSIQWELAFPACTLDPQRLKRKRSQRNKLTAQRERPVSQIVDLTRYRLKREIAASGPVGLATGTELLEMYDVGALKVEFKEGEMLLSLSEWALEAHEKGALGKLLTGLDEPTPTL